jgi:hypothetical protein
MAKKKITLETLAAQLQKGFSSVDRKFMALADDIADIKQTMATKEHVIALRTQVNSIEAQLKRSNVEIRLADLEEKVYGSPRR